MAVTALSPPETAPVGRDEILFAPTPKSLARTPGRMHRFLRAVWHDRSLRTQLLITLLAVDLFAALIAGAITVFNARTSTQVEISASMRLAEFLVRERIGALQQAIPANQFLIELPLQNSFVRHVRLSVLDPARRPVIAPASGSHPGGNAEPAAPAWFTALIAPPVEQRQVAVVVNGHQIGWVAIAGEPADEIGEAWDNLLALGAAALVGNVIVIALAYWLFGFVLAPLTVFAGGLRQLERRRYDVRLPAPPARELAAIVDRFNALAAALEAARLENSRLGRRLMTAQDDERRRTALELHDDVGPCLFGLQVNASSIASAAAKLPDQERVLLQARTSDMQVIIERLRTLNRRLLNRLRPMALGHVPLHDIMAGMIHEQAGRHPEIAFSFAAEPLRPSYGDPVDLTIYRCMQEALTNSIRHAGGTSIAVTLGEVRNSEAGSALLLTVTDDGRGIDPAAAAGFGLSGMLERVQALNGRFEVRRGAAGGTELAVRIPLPDGSDQR
jgi:two-component system sensor histidine kinase UhpB